MGNQEELLKKCLEFYSNEENYKNGMIQKDGGLYANQILDIYKTVKQNMQEQSDLFNSIKNDEESLDKYIKGISDLL